ncbi:hypothetical protein AMD27_12140 [Acinetobacter sp. TGL-Y2]|nr:hypothetical protein AMD27_12140 [Acinetobacter sp. TGL-Y2]
MSTFFHFFKAFKVSSQTVLMYVLSVILTIFVATDVIASTQTPKATWYRYYDKSGVANISSSVTPAHIRNGYEALDSNMQVINRNRAYSIEKDIGQSKQREQQSRQRASDLKLKKAYGSSQTAVQKREDSLKNINKQIALQKQQLQQIQKDRILFKRQEMEFFRKGKPVPNDLKDRLNYNMQNLTNTKKNIYSLQSNYRNTQAQYDTIIKRLKAFE